MDSKKSERRTALEYGGQRQIGSGNLPGISNKGDVRVWDKYRIEQKDPQSDIHTLKYASLDVLWRNSVAVGEMPLYLVIRPPYSIFILYIEHLKALCPKVREVKSVRMKKSKKMDLQNLWRGLTRLSDGASNDEVLYITLNNDERDYCIVQKDILDPYLGGHSEQY